MKKIVFIFLALLSAKTSYTMQYLHEPETPRYGWICGGKRQLMYLPPCMASYLLPNLQEVRVKTPPLLLNDIERELSTHQNTLLPYFNHSLFGKPFRLYIHHISFPLLDRVKEEGEEHFFAFQRELRDALALLENEYACTVITVEDCIHNYDYLDSNFSKYLYSKYSVHVLMKFALTNQVKAGRDLANFAKKETRISDICATKNTGYPKDLPIENYDDSSRFRYMMWTNKGTLIRDYINLKKRHVRTALKVWLMMRNRLEKGQLLDLPVGPSSVVSEYFAPDDKGLYLLACNIFIPEEKH